MNFDEYRQYDALGLKALLDAGDVSAKELHQLALGSIQKLNPHLNFLVSDAPQEARRALHELDPQLPFAGVPFLVKEGVGMSGQPLSLGCRLGKNLKSTTDSEVVKRLKKTGLVILGSTNAPELGCSSSTESLLHGPARNPWNLNHSTGGSSGGASAAVAAGVVPMAQSSDGGGSIRTPAHCCGVFGLMPTRGRNPVGPAGYGGLFGFSRNHVTTRTVRDSAAMLDQLHGDEPGALFRVAPPQRPFLDEVGADPGRLKIAFSSASPSGRIADRESVSAVHAAAKLCETLGHHIEETGPSYDWEVSSNAFSDMWCLGTLALVDGLEVLTGNTASLTNLERGTWLTVQRAKTLTAQQINQSRDSLFRIVRDVELFFEDWDILITPTCLTTAPPLGQINSNIEGLSFNDWYDKVVSDFAPYTQIFNASGQPAMSVPLYQSKAGLPIGIQCVAKFGDEATLIRLASQLEQALPWVQRQPPLTAMEAS